MASQVVDMSENASRFLVVEVIRIGLWLHKHVEEFLESVDSRHVDQVQLSLHTWW